MKRALILGGSSGMGKATVAKLAPHYDEIVIVHRDRKLDSQKLAGFVKEMEALHSAKIPTHNIDATDKVKVADVIATVKDGGSFQMVLHAVTRGNLGKLDPLENGLKAEDLHLTMDSMCMNVQLWNSHLLQHGLLEEDSRFITLTSEGSTRYWPGYGAVALAKSALETLTKYLAVEMSKYGVRYNCVFAGVTETPSLRLIPNVGDLIEFTKQRNPYGRLTQPEDVANAIYLLTLPEASWINGALIHVDGGEHLV